MQETRSAIDPVCDRVLVVSESESAAARQVAAWNRAFQALATRARKRAVKTA